MPQWNPKSLTLLICSFSGFLIIFNIFAFYVGTISKYFTFSCFYPSFSLTAKNLQPFSYPLYIVFKTHNEKQKEIQCKLFSQEDAITINKNIQNGIEYFWKLPLGFSSSNLEISISPLILDTEVYLRVQNNFLMMVIIILRYIFIVAIGICFSILFKNGKNLSVLRSVLIIQICSIFMLDPLKILSELFPYFSMLHYFLFCLGWWRASCELFLEYAPLVRQKASFFKYFNLVPCISILFCYFYQEQIFHVRILAISMCFASGSILIIICIWFIMKSGNISAKSTLIIHLTSGIIPLTFIYYIKVFSLLSESFRDSFFSYSAEISFLFVFAMFQFIFQNGESANDSNQRISNQQTNTKYEKIEELLESLTNLDDDVKFEFPDK